MGKIPKKYKLLIRKISRERKEKRKRLKAKINRENLNVSKIQTMIQIFKNRD